MIKPQLEYLYTNDELRFDAFKDYVSATKNLLNRWHRYYSQDQKELYERYIKSGRVIELLSIWLDDFYKTK